MKKRKAWNRAEVDSQVIRTLYRKQGMTAAAVAKKLEVKDGVIYQRLREMGITRSNSEAHVGIRPANYRGWYIETRSGYKMIGIETSHKFACMGLKFSTGRMLYIREHRLVMAEHLGRSLGRHEVVHHINGDKLDNRIENLELIQGQARHQGHTVSQNEWNRVWGIIKNCARCRAALLATLPAKDGETNDET